MQNKKTNLTVFWSKVFFIIFLALAIPFWKQLYTILNLAQVSRIVSVPVGAGKCTRQIYSVASMVGYTHPTCFFRKSSKALRFSYIPQGQQIFLIIITYFFSHGQTPFGKDERLFIIAGNVYADGYHPHSKCSL